MTSTVYMLVFSAALVITYLLVRLDWVRESSAFIAGTMLNSLFFFLYSTARQNTFSYALVIGLLLGIVFTGISVLLGSFFKRSWADAVEPDGQIVARIDRAKI